jgi:hypothetical protein
LVTFEGRSPGCVLAPDEDEALCIAEEETGAKPRTAQPLRRASFPLLNCVGAMQREGILGRCLATHAERCVQECPLKLR